MNNPTIEVNRYDVRLLQDTLRTAQDSVSTIIRTKQYKEEINFGWWLTLESLLTFAVENCPLMSIEAVSDDELNNRFGRGK